MKQTAAIAFICFLQYCHNSAFIRPVAASLICRKPDYYHVLNSQENGNEMDENGFEIDASVVKKNTFRLGRTKDQDGKSNIWSVEPKMEVVEEEITELNKNILTVGLIITGFLSTLPALYLLNQYIQKLDY